MNERPNRILEFLTAPAQPEGDACRSNPRRRSSVRVELSWAEGPNWRRSRPPPRHQQGERLPGRPEGTAPDPSRSTPLRRGRRQPVDRRGEILGVRPGRSQAATNPDAVREPVPRLPAPPGRPRRSPRRTTRCPPPVTNGWPGGPGSTTKAASAELVRLLVGRSPRFHIRDPRLRFR